ncbi:uncharacterized protein LOC109712100 [Ananas comosus]|uniref:Glycosyltransferases n=1 Tax=Ananas comosus TaxID=4615 RepID=A0A6P5F557_ANACO|nr:uncharacterized protein LOC109712100 [Ananas comosus]
MCAGATTSSTTLIECHHIAGVVHFAVANKVYDLQLFEEIRRIKYGLSAVVQFVCSYVTLPLYARVLGSNVLHESGFYKHKFDAVIHFAGLKAVGESMAKPESSGVSFTSRIITVKPREVSEVGSLLGRASTAGLGKAVEVLDTLGSSMSSLNPSSGFVSGVATKGNKILILAFEVANTIVKGANLMQSLSKESVSYLKEMVLPSEGVQRLISDDISELLRIAAADKRQELKVFSLEVVRFGNRCKDPQWHNLDRYFARLESEITPQKQLKARATENMEQLMTLVRHTADLYHKMHDLDKFELDYRRKLQEENSVASQRGDTLQILRQELKSQRKHVRSLKKKTLWSKILED